MEPIQVNFTFTKESFGKAQVFIMLRLFKKGMAKWFLLAAALLWLGTKLYFDRLNFLTVANMATYVAVFVIVWWLLFRWLSRRNFSKFPNLQHPIHYTFMEEEVQLKTHTTEGVLQWSTFQRAEEAKDFFLLYQNAFMASPVLKSGFNNDASIEKFRQLLRSKNLMDPQ